MNDIWQFFVSLGDGFRDALGDINPLPILAVAILLGLLFKPDSYALKAAFALIIVLGASIFYPVVSGHQPRWPDFRHLGPIVQIFVLYVLAYGMIGVLGSLKSAMSKSKGGAAKPAH